MDLVVKFLLFLLIVVLLANLAPYILAGIVLLILFLFFLGCVSLVTRFIK